MSKTLTKKLAAPSLMSDSTMIWFRPTKNFFDYFAAVPWRWKQFHDCGAGMGLLTKEMRKRKFDVKAYDMFPRDSALIPDSITCNTGDPKDYDYDPGVGDVTLLARPCHHPLLIDATLERAVDVGDAFYIGHAESIVPDLADFRFEIIDCGRVGENGEVLVRVLGQLDKLLEYRQIESRSNIKRPEWWWYLPGRNRYQSSPGALSGFGASGDEKVLDVKYYGNEFQVSVPKEEGCDPGSPMGWIAPDGEWFGAKYANHDWVMENVVGIQVSRAEKLGFIRCQGADGQSMLWTFRHDDFDHPRKPTPKQAAMLKAKGYDPKGY